MKNQLSLPLVLLLAVSGTFANSLVLKQPSRPSGGTIISEKSERYELVINPKTNSLDVYALDSTQKDASKELALTISPDELPNLNSTQQIRFNLVDIENGIPHYQAPISGLPLSQTNPAKVKDGNMHVEKEKQEEKSRSKYEERLMNRYPP
jgi:hypothetical protein